MSYLDRNKFSKKAVQVAARYGISFDIALQCLVVLSYRLSNSQDVEYVYNMLIELLQSKGVPENYCDIDVL